MAPGVHPQTTKGTAYRYFHPVTPNRSPTGVSTIHSLSITPLPPKKNPPLSTASLPVRSRQLVTAPLQRRPQLLTPGPSRRRTQDGAQGNRQPDTLHACTFLFGHGYWRNGGGHCWFLVFSRCLRELIVEIVEDDRKRQFVENDSGSPLSRSTVGLWEYVTTIRD